MSSVLFNKITKDPQMLKLPETEKLKKVHKTSIQLQDVICDVARLRQRDLKSRFDELEEKYNTLLNSKAKDGEASIDLSYMKFYSDEEVDSLTELL